jgi:hypothetical protein
MDRALTRGELAVKLTTRAVRRISAAAAAVCAATFVPAIALAAPGSLAAPGPRASQAAAAVPLCQTPGLVIWLNTSGNGTLGSVYYHLEFTNLSGRSCTLNGFPFLAAVDLHGHQVGRRAAFDHSTAPHQVTLGRGKTVTAVLQVVDAGNYPRAACHPVTAAGLRVYPPNQTRSKIVPFPLSACAKVSPRILFVGPVRK